MDYRALSALVLRLAGLCILVSGVAAMPQTFVSLLMYSTQDTTAPPLLSVFAQTIAAASASLFIGGALIVFPTTVANRIIGTHAVGSEGSAEYTQFQSLAFSVLGFYFIAVGLFDMVYWYARARLYYAVVDEAAVAFPQVPAMTPDDFSGLVSAAAYLVGGLVVLFGARGISRLVQNARGAGADIDA